MSSQRCPACGLVNWSDAETCKRCNTFLNAPADGVQDFTPPMPSMPIYQGEKPQTVMGVLMVLWGFCLLAAGLYLLSFGPISPVLAAAPAIVISGIMVMRGRDGAMGFYFVGIVVMGLWMAVDKGAAAIGTILFPMLIGLLIAKRKLPILAGLLIVISCIGLVGAVLIPHLLLSKGKVAWQDFRPAYGTFSVKMPSKPVEHNPQSRKFGAYTLTNHPYESTVRGQGATLYVVVDFSPVLQTEGLSYDTLLDGELNYLINATNSTLVTKRPTTINGYPGLEFEVKPPANLALESPRVFGKLFMNSEHLYLMQITASETSELLAGKDQFLNPSFSYQASAAQP
jgi:hypothetical protein